MLPSFYIENFRLFDTLSINRLSRVNLVAGKNNVGKSAFLEAVLLYVSDASFEKIHALIQSRQENFDPDSRNHLSQLQLSPFKHFFKGHKIPSLDDKGIILAEKKDTSPLVIKIAAYIIEDYDDKRIRRKLSPQESSSFNPDELKPSSFEISLVTEKDGITQPLFPFLSEAMDLSDLIRLKNIGVRIQSKKKSRHQGACQFVSTQGLNDDEAAELWDSINLTDLEADVMNGLKLVENKITGLAFVKSENSNDRIPVIKLKDHEDRIPLKSLGDGVTKVFHIILSLVNAKDGVLLIDEFENGLHWSVQQSVWDVLFKLAETLNVQIFCTTHSSDCIKGFECVWKQFPENGAYFRLFTRNGNIQAQEYDVETLSDSLETDVEVR